MSSPSSSWLELYETNSSSDVMSMNENAIPFLQTARNKKATDVAQTLLDFPASAFFMGTLKDGKVHVNLIHHIYKMSPPGIPLRTDETCFGFLGLGIPSEVIAFDHQAIFQQDTNTTVKTPSLHDFIESDNIGNLLKLPEHDDPNADTSDDADSAISSPAASFHPSLGIIIPPFLVAAIGRHNADALEPMLSDVATTLINHTARLPDDESNCLLLLSYPILQALWLLGQKDLDDNPGIAASIPEMTSFQPALQKATELQASVLTFSEELATAGPTELTDQTQALLLKCIERQNDLQARMIEDKIGKTSTKDRFSDSTRNTILRFSAASKDHPATGFSKSLSVIVENPKSQAQNNLAHELGNILRGTQVIDNAKAAMFYNLSFQNARVEETPNGLSIFFATPAPIFGSTDEMQPEELDLRKQTKTLTEDQIAKLSKSKASLPKDFSDFLEMIENFEKELRIITSNDSIISKNFAKVTNAVLRNSHVFKSRMECNKLFVARFLQKIDLRIQRFLSSCTTNSNMDDLDWDAINFERDMDKILLHSEDLIISVPVIVRKLLDSTNKDGGKDDGKCKSGDDTSPGGSKNPKLHHAVTNDKVNPDWKLRPNENYAKVFGKHVDSIPMFHEQPICAKFQICGACGFGKDCPRKASHCVLTNDAKNGMTTWVQKCRSEASRN